MSAGNTVWVFSWSICVFAALACGPKPHTSPVLTQSGENDDAGVEDAALESEGPDGAPQDARTEAPALGSSLTTAIEVCLPQGQIAYLSRLRCAGAVAPRFERVAHDGYRNEREGDDDYRLSAEQVRTRRALADGERDLHPVDRFSLACPDADVVRHLYFDMYHCEHGAPEFLAPPGFTLAPPAELPAPEK